MSACSKNGRQSYGGGCVHCIGTTTCAPSYGASTGTATSSSPRRWTPTGSTSPSGNGYNKFFILFLKTLRLLLLPPLPPLLPSAIYLSIYQCLESANIMKKLVTEFIWSLRDVGRGTEDLRDLTEDLRVYPRAVDSVSGRPRGGCFHAGFLNRAQLFPLQES